MCLKAFEFFEYFLRENCAATLYMTTNKEFYYDDLVLVNDDHSKRCSIGLVTKEKPFTPSFLKKKNLKTDNNYNFVIEEKIDEVIKEKSVDVSDDDNDDSSSDGNLYDPPQKETVNVSWFIHEHLAKLEDAYDNTFIESVPGCNLTLCDRSLAVSDIVKIGNNESMKVGTVCKLKLRADVIVLGQDKIITDVDCSRLKWIEPYMGKNLETNFTYESWLGEVLDISFEVIVSFADGARLKAPGTALADFDYQISSIWNPETVLEGCIMEGDASDLKNRRTKFLYETPKHNSKWLSKCKYELVQILVEKLIPIQADMQWVFGYNNKEDGTVPESPPLSLKLKEIEKLEQVHPYPWQCLSVGDIWYMQTAEDDKLIETEPCDSMDTVMYKLINGQLNETEHTIVNDIEPLNEDHTASNKPHENQVSPNCIVKPRKRILCPSRSKNKRKHLSSASSKFGQSSDDNSETEEDNNNKIEKSSEKKLNEIKGGLIQRSNNLEMLKKEAFNRMKPNNMVPVGILLTKSTVDVSWQDGTVTYDVPTTKLLPQMYNIDEHDFFPGDFIVQKFDAQNPNNDQSKHYFGTVIKANSKDRVATVQWFDLGETDSATSSLVKSGEPEQIGVYDISALNEHHFVLGQEVIIKQEVAHKNYPAGFVTRLEPNDGMLVIRWPDGSEISMSPTDLLLTVESVIGGGSASSDDSDGEDSDNLTSDLRSESDSTDWETVEEIETNQEDELYLLKLDYARKELNKLLDKITKVQLLMGSVTKFTLILQANLPAHTGQLINVRDLFKNEKSQDDDDVTIKDGNETDISIIDQQYAIRTLHEIRQDIGLIYKHCNDVEIKRMFRFYRPKDFLSFRLIKNFIISNVQFKSNSVVKVLSGSHVCPGLQNGDVSATIDAKVPHINNTMDLSLEPDIENKEEQSQSIVAEYLRIQYQNIKSNLQYLKESINIWLLEKSCYFVIAIDNKNGDAKILTEEPRMSQCNEKSDDKDIIVDSQQDCDNFINVEPICLGETAQIVSEDLKPVLCHTDSSDHTMSSCEPIPVEQRGQFIMVESASSSHKFISSPRPCLSNVKFNKAWKRDIKLLSTSLPKGVIVKSFDDRIDLFSVLIVGPSGTPYQHALFFFDIQLGTQYPTVQPSVFYISLASERVNPNLYTEGRVCLSLLGTWNGKGTENWDSKVSSLLQLIVSLQGLILVSEPYYNEAGFEIRKGSDEGKENSQRYNENAINNICQSMTNLLHKPIPVFEKEICEHFKEHGKSLIDIHEYWSSLDDENMTRNSGQLSLPDFPLAPVSKGFQLSLRRHTAALRKKLSEKELQWSNMLN